MLFPMANDKILNVIGVMSGTSMDGIDLAFLETDGDSHIRSLAHTTFDWPQDIELELRACVARLAVNRDFSETPRSPLKSLERRLSSSYVTAIRTFMQDFNIKDVELIGVHGQTVLHCPPQNGQFGQTCQLGDGGYIADCLGIDVVNDFRRKDIEAGGNGAPLAPLYHAALMAGQSGPTLMVNLGGVANLTWTDGEGQIVAFDTGPASALIDDEVRKRFGQSYDLDGAFARQGQVSKSVLAHLLSDPFFDLAPPKSLDRHHFHERARDIEHLSDYDAIATLTAFTVEALCLGARRHVPKKAQHWYICGGGRHNLAIMEGLARRSGVPTLPVEALNLNGDSLEAECFAWLAVRRLCNLPISLPSTTGVPTPMTGGVLHKANF